MSEVTRVRIGDDVAGIAGLAEALAETAARCKGMPDAEAACLLLETLSKRNYIHPGKRELYRQAFLREYRKFLGRPVDEEERSGIHVRVFGPGCPRCEKLEAEVRTVLAECGIDADVEHVSDPKEILRCGILGTPALMIDGRILAAGTVPPKPTIRTWLERAAGRKERTGS